MRRRLLLQVIISAGCLAFSGDEARAQQASESGFVVDRWTTDSGLPQNSINAILQSLDGYLWIATNGGVARFDGSAFTIMTTGGYRGLHSDRVLALAQDRNGRIWLGTEDGLSRFDKGVFTTLNELSGLPGKSVNHVRAHPDGSIWAGFRNGSLVRIDRTGIDVVVPAAGTLGTGMGNMVIDAQGFVWVSTPRGIWRLDPRERVPVRVRPQRRTQMPPGMAADIRSGVWVTTDSGIAHIRPDKSIEYPIRRSIGDADRLCKAGPDCGPWVDNIDINAIETAQPNILWLGTRDGEVWRMRVDSMALRRAKPGEPGVTQRLMVDREGNVWAGSSVSGLARVRPALFEVFTTADGLANDVSAAVFADAQDRVWVGGNCEGLSVRENKQWRTIKRIDGLQHECIWALAQDATGAIWIGSYGGGLGVWRNGMTAWLTVADGLPSNSIFALYRDRAGTIWIGTDNGLAAWQNGSIVVHDGSLHDMHAEVRAILRARDGTLWLGTTSGLFHYVNGRFTAYTSANGLPHDYVRAIYEDAEGTLWLGTYGGGLARFREGRFKAFTTADGLYDNVVSSIIEDAEGNLWMSCNRGVFRVSRRELDEYAAGRTARIRSIVYGRMDGMLSTETNGGFQPAVTRTRDGRFWYPTVRGVAVIDPARALQNPVPPLVVIEGVAVNGRRQDMRAAPALGPGPVDVELTYSGLSFTAPDAVTFRYRLDGLDEDWHEAGTRRTAYYTKLRPGKYRFRVVAANRDGVWSAASTTFDFAVRAYVWQTRWFRAGALIAFAVLLFLMYRMRVRQLQHATELGILESITDGFVALDSNWRFNYVNHTAEALIGKPKEELIEHSFWEVFPRASGTEVEDHLRRVKNQRVPAVFDAPDTPTLGRWIEVRAYPAEKGISIYFSDITLRKEAEETLRNQSLRDELTGVYNRRGFLTLAEQHAVSTQRSGRGFHIVFLDMDGMKRINDSLGHHMGDRALLDAVTLMQQTFRKSDIMGRLGGDEFAVLMAESEDEHVKLITERLLEKVQQLNDSGTREYHIGLSVGISRYEPSDPQPIGELIEEADQRMYAAKRAKGAAR